MSIKTFNLEHIYKIENAALQLPVLLLWESKGKEGIKIIQRVLNRNGEDLKVDGWLGDKSIESINSFTYANKLIRALTSVISKPMVEPTYITIGKQELGVHETRGKRHNQRVLKYHATTFGKYKTDEVPWCGSYVSWVMLEAGYNVNIRYPERAKAWKKFGVKVDEPSLGTIAVKSRRKGGHVCFVVGQSKDGRYLYCLGGNQNDAVTIGKYKRSVFTDFRLPKGIDKIDLPIYKHGKPVTSEG